MIFQQGSVHELTLEPTAEAVGAQLSLRRSPSVEHAHGLVALCTVELWLFGQWTFYKRFGMAGGVARNRLGIVEPYTSFAFTWPGEHRDGVRIPLRCPVKSRVEFLTTCDTEIALTLLTGTGTR